MLIFLLNLLGVLFLTISGIHVWSILLNKKTKVLSFKFIIFTIILLVLSLLNYNNILRFTVMTIYMAFYIMVIFKEKIKISIITIFYTQTINLLLELLFSISIMSLFDIEIILGDSKLYQVLLVLFADIFISIFSIILMKTKIFNKIHKSIIKATTKIKLKHVLLALLPIVFIFNSYLIITYYQLNTLYVFVLNNISIYIIVVIFIILINKENAYIKINDKYNTTLNSLKEYEDILDKYRISTHENKNQLLTIRNMLLKTNKNVICYIDKIVENKLKDNEKIMIETTKIPVGGLRGLIYSKILLMEELNIKHELFVSNEVKTVDLINNIDDYTMLDICKIIGVYLDNSIQAVENIKPKHIGIKISIYSNFLEIAISNNYKGKIDLNLLETKGYTSKKGNRGYGLTLAKEIIDRNKKLSNEKSLSKTIFTQKLKIKM